MKSIVKIILLLAALCNFVKAQKTPDSVLIKKAKLEIYDNPDHTIKIGEQLLKKSHDIKTSINLYMLLSTANIAKRNFEYSIIKIRKQNKKFQKEIQQMIKTS